MNRRILALVLAGVCALAAGVAVVMYVGRADDRAVVGQEPVKVWVTTKAISRGTSLADARKDGAVVEDVAPARAVPAGAVRDLGGDGLIATSEIAAGEILLSGRFSAEKAGPETLSIPSGHLAVSAELTDPQRVASFVRPGDDVAVFFAPKGGGVAYVLLPRVLVLGTGMTSTDGTVKTDKRSEDKEVSTQVMTLSLTPDQSVKLVAAAADNEAGNLYFGLLAARTTVPDDTLGSALPKQFQSLLPQMLDRLEGLLSEQVSA